MSPAHSVFVILGAAVRERDRASNAMRRRVEGALISAQGIPDTLFLVSGGVGEQPPSEGRVRTGSLRGRHRQGWYQHITLATLAHAVLAILHASGEKTPDAQMRLSVSELRHLLTRMPWRGGTA